GVRSATRANLRAALGALDVGPGDACIVHMSSHGTRRGFQLGPRVTLTPRQLDAALDETCGRAPTVLLISACLPGVFTGPAMRQPNRVILTAARRDRTSFGCSAELELNYWDGCVLEHLPGASSWRGLHERVRACIARKERHTGVE